MPWSINCRDYASCACASLKHFLCIYMCIYQEWQTIVVVSQRPTCENKMALKPSLFFISGIDRNCYYESHGFVVGGGDFHLFSLTYSIFLGP